MKKIIFIAGLVFIIVAFLWPEETREFVDKVVDNSTPAPEEKPITIEVVEVKKDDEDLTA